MIPLLERRLLRFELLDLIAEPQALEVLQSEKQHEDKDHDAQPEQTEAVARLLDVHLATQAGVVDLFDEVDFRQPGPARRWLVTPALEARYRKCGGDGGHESRRWETGG